MNIKEILISNVNVLIDNKEIINADVLIKEGKFFKIDKPNKLQSENKIDGNQYLMLPGFINIHDDTLEKILMPRRGFKIENLDIEAAVDNVLNTCFSQGITTNYFAITSSLEPGIRNWEICNKIIEGISKYRECSLLEENIKINLRYEISCDKIENLIQVLENEMVDIVTFNDHAPGGVSGWSEEKYFRNINYRHKLDYEEYKQIFFNLEKSRENFWEKISKLREIKSTNKVFYGIHDVNSIKFLENNLFDFLEFPLDINTAKFASKQNISIIMGAPNYLYGTSQKNGISVKELLNNHIKVGLCSDYILSSLKDICKKWKQNKDNLEIINMITINLTHLLGLNKGVIKENKDADFILLKNNENNTIELACTYVKGKRVYKNWRD
ncbi:MAG: amidohydrolase family protein [Clostridium sp.]